MIKKITFIAIFASMLFSTLSCQKSTELMIVGKWLIDDVGRPNAHTGAYWQFNASGAVTFFLNPKGEKNGFYKGEWKVKKVMLRRYIEIKMTESYGEIESSDQTNLTGTWRIDFLNNREMGIVRIDCPDCPTEGASYIRRDFTKIK
ncbi:MAG: hypothetical protein LBR55_06180 [Bacteroidales bacterium]|jgi:hypothetical protein|nr:hypothetical protein [Bacteroidales bacterium]